MVRVVSRVLSCVTALVVPIVGCGTGTESPDESTPTSGTGGSTPQESGRGGSPTSAGTSSGGSSAGTGAGGISAVSGNGGRDGGGAGSAGRGGSGGAGGAGAGSGGTTSPSGGSATGGMAGSSAGASTGGGGASGAGGGIPDAPTKTFVYVGTGDYGKANGGKVRAYTLDESSLALAPIESAAAGTLPSFLVIAPDGQALYAGDESGGAVRAFSLDRASGKLTALNSAEGDGDPVYLNVDRSGKFLFAAYYNQGGLETFAIESDRRVGASKQSLKTGQQAHSIVLSADNAFAFVPHKGSNYVAQFKFDAGTGQLAANTPANLPVSGGPRHLTFHPSKPFAYLMNELDSTLHAFGYDAAKGVLSEIDSKSALPSGSGNSSGADVRVEPNGNFVYASNRTGGNSTLAIFSIDGTSGKLTSLGHTPTRGNTPRQFAIHPEGRIVLVANQDSNNLASFRLDPTTGMLTYVATTDVGDKAWSVVFLTVPR